MRWGFVFAFSWVHETGVGTDGRRALNHSAISRFCCSHSSPVTPHVSSRPSAIETAHIIGTGGHPSDPKGRGGPVAQPERPDWRPAGRGRAERTDNVFMWCVPGWSRRTAGPTRRGGNSNPCDDGRRVYGSSESDATRKGAKPPSPINVIPMIVSSSACVSLSTRTVPPIIRVSPRLGRAVRVAEKSQGKIRKVT